TARTEYGSLQQRIFLGNPQEQRLELLGVLREGAKEVLGLGDHRRDDQPPRADQRGEARRERDAQRNRPGHGKPPGDDVGKRGEVHTQQDSNEQQDQNRRDPAEKQHHQRCKKQLDQRRNQTPSQVFNHQPACSSSSSTSSASAASRLREPAPSCRASEALPGPSEPIFSFNAASCWSTDPLNSSDSNWRLRLSPERSSVSSAAASALRSRSSIFSAIRSKLSSALRSDIDDIVSWMRCCASARRCRAISTVFFRLASSILSL